MTALFFVEFLEKISAAGKKELKEEKTVCTIEKRRNKHTLNWVSQYFESFGRLRTVLCHTI